MLLITLTAGLLGATAPEVRTGDIVLQASSSGISSTIQRATSSIYSHVGLVEVTPAGKFVIEAIEPVSRTPFESWLKRGGGHFTLLRPRLAAAQLAATVAQAATQLGKPYDSRYTWDDDKLYCSELVVKAFERGAHLELGRKVRLDTLKLTGDEKAMATLMGVPLSQEVVPPGTLAEDPHLERIYSDM
jgi:uncharacterized protein YycO